MLHYGRRIAIALNSLFYTLGPLTMALAPNASVLLLGRFVVGLGIGLSAVVTPAYLGEISPAHLRGRIVESYEILLCIGMLLSAGMDVALGSNWRWMVSTPEIPETADEDMHLSAVFLGRILTHQLCNSCGRLDDNRDLSRRRLAYRAYWGWSCQV